MLLYFDKTGQLLEQLDYGQHPRVGSTNLTIFAYFDELDVEHVYTSALIKFKRPDLEGSEYPSLFMVASCLHYNSSIESSNYFSSSNTGGYRGFAFDFSKIRSDDQIVKMLDTPGMWEASITLINSSTGFNVTGLIKFSVGGAVSSADDDPTEIGIETIIENIALSFNSKLDQDSDIYVRYCEDFVTDAAQATAHLPKNFYGVGVCVYDKTTNSVYEITAVHDSEDPDYVYAEYTKLSDFVTLSTDQIITGNKTFNGQLITPYIYSPQPGNTIIQVLSFYGGGGYLTTSLGIEPNRDAYKEYGLEYGLDIGNKTRTFRYGYFKYGLRDGNNNNYGLKIPDTTNWVIDHTIATIEELVPPTDHTYDIGSNDYAFRTAYVHRLDIIGNLTTRSRAFLTAQADGTLDIHATNDQYPTYQFKRDYFAPGMLSGQLNLGRQYGTWKDIFFSGALRDGNNDNYGLKLPDTTSWSANKVVATTADLTVKEDASNKVTSITDSSTDVQYPSAKAVWDLVSTVKTNSFQVVSSLPVTGQEGIIYLVETPASSGIYEQYIWEGNDYIDLGTTQIDLSGYYDKDHSLIPNANGTLDIGSSSYKFNGLYLAGSAHIGSNTELNDTGTYFIVKYDGNSIIYANNSYIQANRDLIPTTNNTRTLGSSSYTWKDAYISGSLYLADLSLIKSNGTDALQFSGSQTIAFGTLRPNATNTRDLGSSSFAWKDLYLSGKIAFDSTHDFKLDGNYFAFSISNTNYALIGTSFSMFRSLWPTSTNTYDLGSSSYIWKNLYIAGSFMSGNNANYGLRLPDTTSYTANKIIATTDDLTAKEDVSNKVISINSLSTNVQYPSAKCVYDNLVSVREVAEGKCKSYVLSYATVAPTSSTFVANKYKTAEGNPLDTWQDFYDYVQWDATNPVPFLNASFNSQNNDIGVQEGYIITTDNHVVRLAYTERSDIKSDCHTGDVLIVIETDVPDRWADVVSEGDPSVDGCHVFKLETTKIDLSSYVPYDGATQTLNMGAQVVQFDTFDLEAIGLRGTSYGTGNEEVGALYIDSSENNGSFTIVPWDYDSCTVFLRGSTVIEKYGVSYQAVDGDTVEHTYIGANHILINDFQYYFVGQDITDYLYVGFDYVTGTIKKASIDSSDDSISMEDIPLTSMLYNKKVTDNTLRQITYENMSVISLSADATFTFKGAPTNCVPEYKAIITNSGNASITITLPVGVSVETNDDNITVSSNTFTLPSGVSVELNSLSNWCIVYNHNLQ